MCVCVCLVLTLTHQLENVTHTLSQLKAVNGGCVIESLMALRAGKRVHDGAFLLNTVVAGGSTSIILLPWLPTATCVDCAAGYVT